MSTFVYRRIQHVNHHDRPRAVIVDRLQRLRDAVSAGYGPNFAPRRFRRHSVGWLTGPHGAVPIRPITARFNRLNRTWAGFDLNGLTTPCR